MNLNAGVGRSRDINNFDAKSAQLLKERLCENAIEPFFRYFNDKNYNLATSSWTKDGETHVVRIFSRCVVCNVERFPELKSGDTRWNRAGVNQNKCHPCWLKLVKLDGEMNQKSPEIYALFLDLFNKKFYKPFPHQKVYNGYGEKITYL